MIRVGLLAVFWLSLVVVQCAAAADAGPIAVHSTNKSECLPGAHDISPDDSNNLTAPDRFLVHWSTSISATTENSNSTATISIEVIRTWSPLGADRFYQLILDNFYNCAGFFRVVPNFVVQFGLAAQPSETDKWRAPIRDDPWEVQTNAEGTLTYATAGKDTRTTQLFVNLRDNSFLDKQGFTPFGRVILGMEVLRQVYNPTPDDSGGVDQGELTEKGNKWLLEKYPGIDLIWKTTLEESAEQTTEAASEEWQYKVNEIPPDDEVDIEEIPEEDETYEEQTNRARIGVRTKGISLKTAAIVSSCLLLLLSLRRWQT